MHQYLLVHKFYVLILIVNQGMLSSKVSSSKYFRHSLRDSKERRIAILDSTINNNIVANTQYELFLSKNWQKLIGYVPQDVYLNNSSIKENIALGVDIKKIDELKVINALKKANIYDFVENLPEEFIEKTSAQKIEFGWAFRREWYEKELAKQVADSGGIIKLKSTAPDGSINCTGGKSVAPGWPQSGTQYVLENWTGGITIEKNIPAEFILNDMKDDRFCFQRADF